MSFYKVIHYIFGEYVINVEDGGFERLITRLGENGIAFWSAERSEDGCRLHTSLFACEDVIKLAGEHNISAAIADRRGIPFWFLRYKRRYGLLLGMVLGLILLFLSEMFIWKLTVSGSVTVPESEIISVLQEHGISVGAFIPDIDPDRNANEILLTEHRISSLALNIHGTHLEAVILERTPTPDITDTAGYYNVIATHDGTVVDIDAYDGTPEVKSGDTVFAGQLLINSFMERRNGTFCPTHARGMILAEVELKYEITVPLVQTQKHFTGKTARKTVRYVLGRSLNIFSAESPFEYSDFIVGGEDGSILGFIELPVSKTVITYYEYYPVEVTVTDTEAELIANGELKRLLSAEGYESLLKLDTELRIDREKGTCVLYADAKVLMNIAKEVPFFMQSG